eukprot:s3702_g6.t1
MFWKGLHLVVFSTYLSPAECVRDEDKLSTLDSLLSREWFRGPEIPLQSSGVSRPFSDLETSHTGARNTRILDLDVTSSDQAEVEAEVEARSRLLQGVQQVLRSLRRSARMNRRNWRNTGRLREILRDRMAMMAANGTEVKEPPMVLSGKEHPQAKYDLKQSTDGLEGLADIAENVEDATEDAAQKARAVDKAFAEHQARLQEMGKEIDHLAISAEKYQLEVLHFFAQEEAHEKFSPLAQVAAGVK